MFALVCSATVRPREIRSGWRKARTVPRCINVTLLARLHYRNVYIYERSVVLEIYPFIEPHQQSVSRVVDLRRNVHALRIEGVHNTVLFRPEVRHASRLTCSTNFRPYLSRIQSRLRTYIA